MSITTRAVSVLGACALFGGAVAGCGSGGSRPPGNATDRAFADQMIPHHELVVEMAADTASASHRADLRRFGAGLARSRQQQLESMRSFADSAGVHPLSGQADGRTMRRGPMADDTRTLRIPARDMDMTMDIGDLASKRPFDRVLFDTLIPYHQCEIRMARAELARGRDGALRQVAREVLASEPDELRQMNAWRTKWFGAPSPAGGLPTS